MPWFVAGESKGDPPTLEVGDVVELGVRDNEGRDQREILVGVVNLCKDHHGGLVFRGKFLGAADPYYFWWMNSGTDAPSRENGYYHLCHVESSKCPPSKRYEGMVHSDRYRNHRGNSLTTRKIDWLGNKIIRDEVTKNLGEFRGAVGPARGEEGKPHRSGRAKLDWGKDADDDVEDDGEESEEETPSDESSDAGVEMKKRLDQLRKDLLKAEKDMEDRRETKKSMKKSRRERKDRGRKERATGSKKKVTLPHAGDGEKERKSKLKRKKRKRRASDESHSKSDGEDGKKHGRRSKKKKRKKRDGDTITRDSGDDDTEMRKAKQASLFVGKPKEEKEEAGGRDRGPFGEGFSMSYGEEESESTEADFRKGPSTPAKSGQLKLIKYANRFPGRLASRMLVKMEQATARGVGGPNQKGSELTPPVAMNHLLTVLIPSLGERAGMRTVRELKTLGVILDHLAVKQFAKAADVVSQRIKALERATHEKHWGAAQFLELLPPEGTMLLDRDEEMYLAREYLLDQKLKSYDQPKRWNFDKPGKGYGKEKGHKGEKGGKDGKGEGKKNQWAVKGDGKKEDK